MSRSDKFILTKADKKKYIDALAENLLLLRLKAQISQDELSNLVGVSRQTFGAVERLSQPMSWNTYLSLILFFNNHSATHAMLHDMGLFPAEILKRFNDGQTVNLEPTDSLSVQLDDIIPLFDEQALATIKTVLIIELARCQKMPGNTLVKFFDGINLITEKNDHKKSETAAALENIRKNQNDK